MSDPTGSHSPATVLVVDDEDEIRELAREILAMNGYVVLVAEEGEEALRVTAEHRGPIDLPVSDMVMPRMSGSQLLERLALARRDLKALYISGYADQKTAATHNLRAPPSAHSSEAVHSQWSADCGPGGAQAAPATPDGSPQTGPRRGATSTQTE